jgi:hypothetical protein
MLPLGDKTLNAELLQALKRAGYTAGPDTFATARPDRLTVALTTRTSLPAVAKWLPAGEAATTFRHMEKLWRSSFGEKRQSPGLPQPLECLPELGVLVMERVPGRPLAESGLITEGTLQEAMKLLADLHSCEVEPDTRRSWRGILRSVLRKAEIIARVAPQYADAITPVIQSLQAHSVRDSELVPGHGDFSPRNVLAGGERMVIIDWDRFQQADPARDVAYFGTFSWRADLRRGRWPNRKGLKQVVQAYCVARPGAELEKQMPFHVAAGLVRTAASLVQLWPQEAWLVPALAKAALRELEAA